MPVAILVVPALLNAFVVVGAGLLSLAIGREPNPETAYLLMPGPMALVLLRLADVYELRGTRRRVALLGGVLASLGWWVVGVVGIAAAAQIAA
jgi:hypothetical protein